MSVVLSRVSLAALLLLCLNTISQSFSIVRLPQHASSGTSLSVETVNGASSKQVTFAQSIRGKLSWKAAQKSAAIYMDPAASKIANITISWEPDISAQLLRLKQDKGYTVDRPYMVGVVGIPGSGKSTSSEILANVLPNW